MVMMTAMTPSEKASRRAGVGALRGMLILNADLDAGYMVMRAGAVDGVCSW